MTQDEIVEKLRRFLADRAPLREENEAVYLMVEIRKLIDRANARDRFSVLKFYADWTVHTEKDRLTPTMLATIDRMRHEATAVIRGNQAAELYAVKAFAYMEALRLETVDALNWFGLGDRITAPKEAWLAFVSALVRVLENQPINTRSRGVTSVAFLPAERGWVWGRITLDGDVDGQPHFDFREAL